MTSFEQFGGEENLHIEQGWINQEKQAEIQKNRARIEKQDAVRAAGAIAGRLDLGVKLIDQFTDADVTNKIKFSSLVPHISEILKLCEEQKKQKKSALAGIEDLRAKVLELEDGIKAFRAKTVLGIEPFANAAALKEAYQDQIDLAKEMTTLAANLAEAEPVLAKAS